MIAHTKPLGGHSKNQTIQLGRRVDPGADPPHLVRARRERRSRHRSGSRERHRSRRRRGSGSGSEDDEFGGYVPRKRQEEPRAGARSRADAAGTRLVT